MVKTVSTEFVRDHRYLFTGEGVVANYEGPAHPEKLLVDKLSGKPITVDVIQFVPPYGRKKHIPVELPNDVLDQYLAMTSRGIRLEAIILSNGQVSLTVAGRKENYDLEVVPNGPFIQTALREMLLREQWEANDD